MPSNWIELVPICSDVYMYQADLVCEDCGMKIIKQLEKEHTKDTGDSDDFPQGPYSDGGGEADSPQHCGMNEKCINKVHVPGGVSIGCPLGNSLTSEGVAYVREAVAKDITDESAHKRGVGRLWANIYSDVLHNCPLHRIDLTKTSIANSLIKILNTKKSKILPEIFTDCSYVYGGWYIRLFFSRWEATPANPLPTTPNEYNPSPEETNLWRIEPNNTGGFNPVESIAFPASEIRERTLQDMIEEAISEGAWD